MNCPNTNCKYFYIKHGKNGKIIIPADSKYYDLIRNELNQYKNLFYLFLY